MSRQREVRFGLLYTHLDGNREDTTDTRVATYDAQWAALLEHVSWAEGIGFDSIWLSERHFSAYAPGALMLAGAIAARTSRVRIGTNVIAAPLYQALRLAEDAAMVSVLSAGRFDLGIGQGHNEIDFTNLGVNLRNRPSLLEDAVRLMRLAWKGEPFTFHGKRVSVPVEVTLRPTPTHPPRILIGATTEAGMVRALQLGDGFLSAFNGHIKQFAQLAHQQQKPGPLQVFAAQQAVIAEDPEAEWARVGRFVQRHVNQNLPADAQMSDSMDIVRRKMFGLWDKDAAVDTVVRLLTRHPEVVDVHFVAVAGPGEPYESTKPRLEFLVRVVIPEIRERLAVSASSGRP